MLYYIIRPFAIVATHLFFKRILIANKALLQHKGPLLLAVNHPNSFLDAILLCTLFKKPVYALTRGDTFKKKSIARILYMLNMLPVYREREGVENLQHNYSTFNACLKIFEQNGIVLIFSEALCINEWHLRPIRKGTARLALMAWQQNIALKILPIGLNYSSFDKLAKTVHINIGNCIEQKDINNPIDQNGKCINEVTTSIQQQLRMLVYEINDADKLMHKKYFNLHTNIFKKIFLFFPAVMGLIIHWPVYFLPVLTVSKKAKNTGHYDSIVLALFFITYPFVVLGFSLLLYLLTKSRLAFTTFFFIPFCAWSYVQIKNN